MMDRMKKSALFMATALLATACQEQPEPGDAPDAGLEVAAADQVKGGVDGKADASVVATFVDLEFDAHLLTRSSFNANAQIENQLLYTIGQLNGENSVGRLDKLELSNVEISREGELVRIDYSAKLLVAWGDKDDVPTNYTLELPRDVSSDALDAFAEEYGSSCVDFGAHDVDAGSMWYYYRPNRSRCNIDDADILKVDATINVSEVNTTGKYPEYHKVWEDNALKVVAVFGKYKDGATSSSDAGIAAYNKFVSAMKRKYANDDLVTTPENIPSAPGVEVPDVTFEATLEDGRTVEIVALMVDNVRTAGAEFNERYESLSGDADLIAYNGHAGLGANIRALANKGSWQTGQYAIVYMNGCDTYAYVDSALFNEHAIINDDDETGTKYMDIITNAMPSFFRDMSATTTTLITSLTDIEEPRTYEQIFAKIPSSQVVLVSGEQDNEFVPGFGEDDDEPETDTWGGIEEAGEVTRDEEVRFTTPKLAPGTYTFEMAGTADADLYVKIGQAPTAESFDCRPFKAGSFERCTVELNSPSPIHVMVRGWATASNFELIGR